MILKHYVDGSLLYCHPPDGLNDRQQQIYDEDTLITQWNMERVRIRNEGGGNSHNSEDTSSYIAKEKDGVKDKASLDALNDGDFDEEDERWREVVSDVDLDIDDLSLEKINVNAVNDEDVESNPLSNRKQKTKPQHLKKWGKKGRKLRNPEPYLDDSSNVFKATNIGAKISGHDKKKALYGKRGDGEYHRMKHIHLNGRDIDDDGYQFEG